MSEGKDPSINQVQTFRLEESSSQKALLVLILEGKFPDLRDRFVRLAVRLQCLDCAGLTGATATERRIEHV